MTPETRCVVVGFKDGGRDCQPINKYKKQAGREGGDANTCSPPGVQPRPRFLPQAQRNTWTVLSPHTTGKLFLQSQEGCLKQLTQERGFPRGMQAKPGRAFYQT